MKTRMKYSLMFGLVLTIVLSAASNSFAAPGESNAGLEISNQATIEYSVGGVTQPDVLSNPTTFLVDHKVRPHVDGPALSKVVIPNSTNQYLTFTVTNDGNTNPSETLSIRMTAAFASGFNMDDVRIYLDNGDGTLDTEVDTNVTNDNISLARDTSATLFLVADTPNTALDGQTAVYDLIATAWSSSALLPEDTDGDDPNRVQVVWADAAGSAAGDTARNGRHSARGTFEVESAVLTVQKTSSVEYDPVRLTANPMRIPGARVQYQIQLENTGSVAAESVVIVDQIPAGTNFYVGSVTGGTAIYSNDGGANFTYPPSAGTNGADPVVTHVRVQVANIAAGGSALATFEVLIE
jgi:uncharacterized repeat protein (TIGR01451 family)